LSNLTAKNYFKDLFELYPETILIVNYAAAGKTDAFVISGKGRISDLTIKEEGKIDFSKNEIIINIVSNFNCE